MSQPAKLRRFNVEMTSHPDVEPMLYMQIESTLNRRRRSDDDRRRQTTSNRRYFNAVLKFFINYKLILINLITIVNYLAGKN